MLYIANISTHYKKKGKQNYEVRVGGQERYRTIGRFQHKAESNIQSFFEKAASAVEAFNPIADLYRAISDMDNAVGNKPRVDLIALIIANVSENYEQHGIQKYRINRLADSPETNYQECLAEFEHLYEDGAASCFRKAAATVDLSLMNSDYKSILKNATKKPEGEKNGMGKMRKNGSPKQSR